MTFKDLKLQLSKLQSNTNQDNRLDFLRDKPFWIWDKEEHFKQAIQKIFPMYQSFFLLD